MSKSAFLQVAALHKTYTMGRNEVPVLRGVDLSVAEGEFVAVVGASGSGKSTLLHLMGALDVPDRGSQGWKGRVVFDGRNVFDDLDDAGRDAMRGGQVGFVFQFYHLLPELSVLENVLLPLRTRLSWVAFRGRQAALEEDARALLATLKMDHRLKHGPNELSGGERQRVAIARALVARPRLLLADEPTGNLDSRNGEVILDALRAVHAERKQTLVMVTHDTAVAAKADRTVRLKDGRVAAD